ncbi:MAG: CpsB/CapC family capsule biosynthesis tyrosine phosphatase [Gaiellales bacterium]
MPGFVDVHSHVIPSGDDGAQSIDEGLALCREAAEHGTRVLYGTPHVLPGEGLRRERELRVRAAHELMATEAVEFGLDLRLGFELTPAVELLAEDLGRYRLSGLETPSVLIEFPFRGELELLSSVADHAEACGLRPVLAHPERVEAVLAQPDRALRFAERGWPIQVNASSLLGRHGPRPAEVGWWLVMDGHAALVASDGHRRNRPPYLDGAYAEVVRRLGEPRATALFDGSVLGGSVEPAVA